MATVTLTDLSSSNQAVPGANVSLEIGDREFVAFVGDAAAGPATILRMIAGLEGIRAGEIQIGDRRVNDLAAKDRAVAMVFRDGALYSHLTVFENMALGLKVRKFAAAEIKRRVEDAAEILGLEQVLGWKPGKLSLAQRQRVGLGRAIVRQPKVILFDHPLADLDLEARALLRMEIVKLHQRLEATLIYATDDPEEAMMMADRVAVLANGVLRQMGTPAALYREPADLFVARFFGRPAMNLIHGTLKQERDALVFTETGEGTIEVRLADGSGGAREFVGKPVVLGIRPQDLEVAPLMKGERRSELAFPVLLDLVEPLGAEADLHLSTGAHTVICRTRQPVERAAEGQRMQLALGMAAAHLFDPISTRRIRLDS